VASVLWLSSSLSHQMNWLHFSLFSFLLLFLIFHQCQNFALITLSNSNSDDTAQSRRTAYARGTKSVDGATYEYIFENGNLCVSVRDLKFKNKHNSSLLHLPMYFLFFEQLFYHYHFFRFQVLRHFMSTENFPQTSIMKRRCLTFVSVSDWILLQLDSLK
jgi:hypothetical protein